MPFSKISLKLFTGKIILPFIVSLLLINNLGYNYNITFQRVQLQFNKPCKAFKGKVPQVFKYSALFAYSLTCFVVQSDVVFLIRNKQKLIIQKAKGKAQSGKKTPTFFAVVHSLHAIIQTQIILFLSFSFLFFRQGLMKQSDTNKGGKTQ